jgi:hypothetical protein
MMLWAQQGEFAGLTELSKFGLSGTIIAVAIYAVVYVWRSDRSSLVDWRVEARGDLKEEREARRAHETAMTKLLTELVASVADIKEGMQGLLEEIRRLKETSK